MNHRESKYRNRKVVTGGVTYDSRKEKKRHDALIVMERCGEISELRTQVPFLLIPAQKEGGKCIERQVTYIADFVYYKNGKEVIEDVKSEITRRLPAYILKRKLMRYLLKKTITEI